MENRQTTAERESNMNQNGFESRGNPGYSYGQQNTYPQNGYPGNVAGRQNIPQNPSGLFQPPTPAVQLQQNSGFGGQNVPAFNFSSPQSGNAYNPASPAPGADGYHPNPPSAAAGGFRPVSQGTVTNGYNPTPQVSATGGFSPVPNAAAAGGYNTNAAAGPFWPAPQASATGGYSPVPPASAVGYSPAPPVSATGGYSMNPPQAANNAYSGYFQPPAPATPTGSFIPKTPFSAGYTSPGYQPAFQRTATVGYPQGYSQQAPGGYPQGYPGYTQPGRVPQSTASQQQTPSQVPLNGGGYVPQPVRVRKRPPERADIILYAAGGVLILLFVLGLVINEGNSLLMKLLFLIPAIGAIALLWLRPVTDDNKRLCFTVVAGALCIAMTINIISLISNRPADDKTRNRGGGTSVEAADTGGGQADPTGSSGNVTAVNQQGYGGSNVPQNTPSAGNQQPGSAVNAEARTQLQTFFKYWSVNDLDSMIELCSPAWRVKQENDKRELFYLLQNRTPVGREVVPLNDPAQIGDNMNFLLEVWISRNNGKDPEQFKMNVRMVLENGLWYVDPASLKSNEVQETPDPKATPVVTPTPSPYIDANTVLYYNTNGGKYYHLDPNCISVHSKYLPLKGTFYFSQIREGSYAELEPCNVCGAPLRR